MEEFPAHLEYTGIYRYVYDSFISDSCPSPTPSRYLNELEAMGDVAYFGLALISGSKLVLSLAVIRHLANWWFLSSVEQWVSPFYSYIRHTYIRIRSILQPTHA